MNLPSVGVDDLASGAGIGLVGRFVGRLLNFLEQILAARLLGPGAFGLYVLGWTLFRLVELVSSLGFDVGVMKYGPEHVVSGDRHAFGDMVYSSLILSLIFSGLLGLSVYQLSPWLATEVFDEPALVVVLQLFALGFPLSGLLLILASVIRVTHAIKYSVLAQDLGQPLLAVLLLLVFGLSRLNTKRLVAADLLSYLLAALLAIYFLWRLLPFLFTARGGTVFPKKEFLLFSITSSAAVFLSTLVFWIDRLWVGYFLSTSDLGIYQAALQVAAIFAVILSALGRVLVPVFSTLHAAGKFSDLEEVFRIGTKWGFYLSLPPVVIILLNPGMLLGVLYGDAYSAGGAILIVLLLGQIANLATGAVGPLLLVGGHQRLLLFLSGAVLVLNTLLCAFFIPRFGLLGAALANAISTGLIYSIALFLVRSKMGLWPYDRRYLRGVVAALAAAICGLVLRSLLGGSPVLSLVSQFAVVTVIFVLALYILGLTREDRAFLAVLVGPLK